MTTLTSETTFAIAPPLEEHLETVDLVLLPENTGTNALRELRYPGDALPPLIYDQNPDRFENFDTAPLTARPALKAETALSDTLLVRWPGYGKDRPIREIWAGDASKSHMTAYFFRRLWEYFVNPPDSGHITWTPKDRIDQAYNIEIESLTVGGQDTVSFDTLALKEGFLTGEVVFTFRIVGEAA